MSLQWFQLPGRTSVRPSFLVYNGNDSDAENVALRAPSTLRYDPDCRPISIIPRASLSLPAYLNVTGDVPADASSDIVLLDSDPVVCEYLYRDR